MSKKKFSGIEIARVFTDEVGSLTLDALMCSRKVWHSFLSGEPLGVWKVTMPGSGRERGRVLGFAQCRHCKWKGLSKEMTPTAGSIVGAPNHKRPRGYCPTCGGKCAWQRISVNQWRLLQP